MTEMIIMESRMPATRIGKLVSPHDPIAELPRVHLLTATSITAFCAQWTLQCDKNAYRLHRKSAFVAQKLPQELSSPLNASGILPKRLLWILKWDTVRIKFQALLEYLGYLNSHIIKPWFTRNEHFHSPVSSVCVISHVAEFVVIITI